MWWGSQSSNAATGMEDSMLVDRGMDCDLGPSILVSVLFPKLDGEVRCVQDEDDRCSFGDLFSLVSSSLARLQFEGAMGNLVG